MTIDDDIDLDRKFFVLPSPKSTISNSLLYNNIFAPNTKSLGDKVSGAIDKKRNIKMKYRLICIQDYTWRFFKKQFLALYINHFNKTVATLCTLNAPIT